MSEPNDSIAGLPHVPNHIIELIAAYGDARADEDIQGAAHLIGQLITNLRPLLVTRSDQAPMPAQSRVPFDFNSLRAAFERRFPLPPGCIRTHAGYTFTDQESWEARRHCERWRGWKAHAESRLDGETKQQQAATANLIAGRQHNKGC